MKKYILIALAALTVIACEKNPEAEDTTPKDRTLSGFAQKGQFVKGSQVTAFAVGSDLVATGESFPANISDDLGAFSIAGKTAAPFFELRAEGYYFNEIEGTTSTNPLYLEAFVKADDTKANINLMTTAIRPRVKKLIKEGKTYSDAISQAQSELLKAIGFTGTTGNFDDMDITGTTDADGMLLAFACMVQNGRSAAEVTTLIQEIASELESKGAIGETVLNKIKANIESINPFRVILCLANYYKEKNLSVSTVPCFYNYLDDKYKEPFVIVDDYIINFSADTGTPGTKAIESAEQIETGLNVLASINFTAEVDIQGATVVKEQILGPAYAIKVQIPANVDMESRTAHVIFKDATGRVLAEREFTQGGNAQYLLIYSGAQTKSDITISDGNQDNPFKEGVEVSVNGTAYTLHTMDEYYGALVAVVPKAEKYEVSYPANAVTSTDHIARVSATINPVSNGKEVLPYYGIAAPYSGFEVQNPATVQMTPCFGLLKFKLGQSLTDEWNYVEITPVSDNEYLAGTASFVPREEDKYLFPDVNPSISFNTDKQRSIRINRGDDPNMVQCYTFPQTLSQGLVVSVCREDGVKLASESIAMQIDIRAGIMFAYGPVEKFIPEAVYMGVGPKWASCNVGACTIESHGSCFAWGEVYSKNEFTVNNYKWAEFENDWFTKYNYRNDEMPGDNKFTLDLEDDAAHFLYGGDWRMPTSDELEVLVANCEQERQTINGQTVIQLTSKINGNILYLPYTNDAFFWSSSLDKLFPCDAKELGVNKWGCTNQTVGSLRYYGLVIRAVRD